MDGMGIKMRSDMTQRAALVELLARVEAGDLWPDDARVILKCAGNLIESALVTDEAFADFVSAYDGDVSDAIALVEYLTPGAYVRVSGPFQGKWQAKIFPTPGCYAFDDWHSGSHPTNPARALLLATLRAKLATMPEGEG